MFMMYFVVYINNNKNKKYLNLKSIPIKTTAHHYQYTITIVNKDRPMNNFNQSCTQELNYTLIA